MLQHALRSVPRCRGPGGVGRARGRERVGRVGRPARQAACAPGVRAARSARWSVGVTFFKMKLWKKPHLPPGNSAPAGRAASALAAILGVLRRQEQERGPGELGCRGARGASPPAQWEHGVCPGCVRGGFPGRRSRRCERQAARCGEVTQALQLPVVSRQASVAAATQSGSARVAWPGRQQRHARSAMPRADAGVRGKGVSGDAAAGGDPSVGARSLARRRPHEGQMELRGEFHLGVKRVADGGREVVRNAGTQSSGFCAHVLCGSWQARVQGEEEGPPHTHTHPTEGPGTHQHTGTLPSATRRSGACSRAPGAQGPPRSGA